jgi:hypothetical protein
LEGKSTFFVEMEEAKVLIFNFKSNLLQMQLGIHLQLLMNLVGEHPPMMELLWLMES